MKNFTYSAGENDEKKRKNIEKRKNEKKKKSMKVNQNQRNARKITNIITL